MKQNITMINDSGTKLVKSQLDKMVEEGHSIEQIVPLGKTTFLVVSRVKTSETTKKKATKKKVAGKGE